MNQTRFTRFAFSRSVCALAVCALSASLYAGPEPINESKNVKEVVPVPAPSCNWTGFYIGINGGYGWGNSRSSSNDEGFGTDGDPQSVSLDSDGAVLGGQLGFNWQLGNWFVIGLEASGGWLDLDDSRFLEDDPPDNFATVDYEWYALITPRIGVSLLNNRLLLYAKGGVAFVNIENRAGDLDEEGIDPDENTRSDDTVVSWTVGGGLEFAFNCHWSIGVEYDYLGDLDHSSSNFNEADEIRQHYHHDNDAHLLTARLNYRFWGGR